ncbi:MAG: LytR C-terminal domain-containing protein [Actinomycetota bacterium]
MTERSRFDRAWPSLVALFGTIAVVLVLLWAFGDDGALVAEDGDIVEEDDQQAEDDEDGDDEDGAADDTASPTPEPTEPASEPVTAPAELRSPVGILNATSVPGLAADAEQLLEEGGWEVPAISNYSGELAETTIYYPDESLLESAEALAAQFPEIGAVEPTIGGLARDRLVLVVTSDWAETYGDGDAPADG